MRDELFPGMGVLRRKWLIWGKCHAQPVGIAIEWVYGVAEHVNRNKACLRHEWHSVTFSCFCFAPPHA